MSASPLDMQGLLAQLGNPQPSQQGGLMGAINAALAPYGGAGGLGIALMGNTSGATAPGAALAQGMQNAQQYQQKLTAQQLQNAQSRLQLAQSGIGLQQSMAEFPYLLRALQQYGGGAQGAAAPAAAITGTSPANFGAYDASAGPALPPASQVGAPPTAPQGPSPSPLSAGLNLGRVLALMKQNPDAFMKSFELDPNYQTGAAVAKDPLTVDKQMIFDAARSGDSASAQAAYLKFLKDAGMLNVDRYGNVVTVGGINPKDLGINSFLGAQGIQTSGGVASPIPGYAGAKANIAGAAAGAEESAKLQAQTAPAGAVPPGGTSLSPTTPTDASGSPRYPIVAPSQYQGAAAINQPGYVPPALRVQTPLRPGSTGLAQQAQFQKDQAGAANTNLEAFTHEAQAANELLAQTAEIRSAANDFTPGKFAPYRAEVLNLLNSADLISDADKERLGSFQEGQKLAIQLQASATKQLGSREAAQVFSYMGKSMPNLTLTPDGLEKVSAYLDGIARYKLARNTYAQRLAAENNVQGVNQVESVFQNQSNPTFFILASASPQARAEMIASMAPNLRAKLVTDWKRAAAAGLAPGPGDYTGQ